MLPGVQLLLFATASFVAQAAAEHCTVTPSFDPCTYSQAPCAQAVCFDGNTADGSCLALRTTNGSFEPRPDGVACYLNAIGGVGVCANADCVSSTAPSGDGGSSSAGITTLALGVAIGVLCVLLLVLALLWRRRRSSRREGFELGPVPNADARNAPPARMQPKPRKDASTARILNSSSATADEGVAAAEPTRRGIVRLDDLPSYFDDADA